MARKRRTEPPSAHALTEEFRVLRRRYEEFSERLQGLIMRLLVADEIDVHAVEYRAKTLESLATKVVRPGKSYRGLAEIRDLTGLRVICYYTEDVDRVAKLIEGEFAVDAHNSADKLEVLAPDQFGYRSVHEWHLKLCNCFMGHGL